MDTANHHNTTTTHNAGGSSRTLQASPSSSEPQAIGLLEIEVATEAFVVGLTEEGREFVGERYFLLATDRAGNRWRHVQTFPGCERVIEADEETGEQFVFFPDLRDQAFSNARTLFMSFFVDGRPDVVNSPDWFTTRPAYGSEAFQQYGGDDDLALELAEGGCDAGRASIV